MEDQHASARHDQSDEIALAPEAWSSEWIERRSNPSPDDYWITMLPEPYPPCKRRAASFGGHFYMFPKNVE
jgi:hypothetical protein